MIPYGDRWALCRPPLYRLLTLWDFMKKFDFNLHQFILGVYGIGKNLSDSPGYLDEISELVGQRLPGLKLINRDFFKADELKKWATKFNKVGMSVSAKVLEEMARDAASEFGRDQNESVQDLARTIKRELESVYLMVVPNDKIDLVKSNQDALYGAVVTRFGQEIGDELREAGLCLAFGRNTASVFHLIRVVEASLREMARRIGVPKSKHMGTWDAVFKEIDPRLKKLREAKRKSRRINERIEFLSEIRLHIHDIKDAWRNRTVHEIAKTYDEPQAAAVYRAVWALMGQLAAKI